MTNSSGCRQMKLGAFFHPTGHHIASWLHPEAQIDAGTNFEHYIELAQTAERGKFDLMFLADALATRDGNLECTEPLAAIYGLFRADHVAVGNSRGDQAHWLGFDRHHKLQRAL